MRISSQHRSHGFSLIEVMIAVVVLATGMLALAALQAKLASNSADAKARSRVAALLTSVLDDQRAAGYAGIAAFGNTTCLATGNNVQKAICTAESDAGISGLKLVQTVTTYYGVSGASGAFTTTVPAAGTAYADYKLIKLTATWKDVTNADRILAATNIASALNITGSSTFLDTPLTASKMSPTVHEENPAATAGVIPIAVGENTDAASTNPQPTIDKALTSTTFTTLTYTAGALDSGISRTIQKRVETTVAECACQLSASGNPIVYTTGSLKGQKDVFLGATVYRPTYWDGTQYVSPVDAKLTPYSAQHPDMVGQQNDLCTVVCRDHHDKSEVTNTVITTGDVTVDAVKYDAVKPRNYTTTSGQTFDRYDRYRITVTAGKGNKPSTISYPKDTNGNLMVASGTSGNRDYIDAARLIRVDGIWRVATDTHAEHMGLLATSPKGFATTSSPDSSAQSQYEDFVIDYMGLRLTQILSNGSAPNGNTLYANHGLDDPTTITATTTTGDYRYLHGRGLYLDNLEQAAIDKLKSINSTCTDYPTCLLPYLPFNTINVTQLENWSRATGNVSVTNSTTSTSATSCTTGGNATTIRACVNGVNTGSDSVAATLGKSNSAVAASQPVSPYELDTANQLTDSQAFTVTGTSTASEYFANLASNSTTLPNGADLAFWTDDLSTTNDPTLQWLLGTNSGFCFANLSRTDTNPNPYDCVTTVPLNTSLYTVTTTIGNYNQVVQQQIDNPCSGGTGTYSQPVLVCYTVTGATVSSVGGSTYTANVTAPTTGVKTSAEQTVISITGTPTLIPKSDATLNVSLAPNGTAVGSYTCDAVTFVPTFTTPTTCN